MQACCEAVVDGGYNFDIWFLRHKAMVLRERHIWFSASYHISQKANGEITRLPKERERVEKQSYGERENIWFTWLVLLSKLSEIQYGIFFFFLFFNKILIICIFVFFFF